MKLGQDEIKLILLTQGRFAILDAEDYDWLSQYKWYAGKGGSTFCAYRARGRTTVNMHLGAFDNQMEAAMAYDDKAAELFGEFAYLNFPERIGIQKWIRRIVWAA